MFPKGLGGVAVVVLAAVAVIAAGFLLSGDATQETRTQYNEVADITGLFTASAEPEYLDYSPSENFTGWRYGSTYYMSGVTYTESDTATDYIVPQADRSAITGSQVSGDIIDVTSALWLGTWVSTPINNPSLVSLETVITDLGLSDDVAVLDIWVDAGGPIFTRYDVQYQAVAPFNKYLAKDPDTRHIIVDVNDTDKRTRLYDSDGGITATVTASEVGVFYGGSNSDLTSDFNYQTKNALPIKYMNAGAGIQVTSDGTIWANGYLNSKLTIVLEKGSVDIEAFVSTGENVEIEANGTTVLVYSDIVGSDGEIVFSWGSWDYLAITIDALGGTFAVAPVTSFENFLDLQISSGRTSELQHQGGTVARMQFSDSTARLAVVDTWTYLDTTTIVYSNPSIDVEDYWTADKQRLRFYSFSMTGDSMTIGGQTFPVSEGLITIEGRQYEINNMTVTWVGTTMTVQTGKMLGPATFTDVADRSVSMAGIWYFNAAYLEGEDVTIEGFGWNPGHWELDGGAAILLWVALCIVGLAVLAAVQKLGISDIAIVLFASIIGIAMMEGFM